MRNRAFLVRATILVLTLTASVVLTPAHSHDYNDGLLAAEVGDYDTAVGKWQPLAKQGDAMAQFNLALLYHRGLGVPIDEAKAVAWYQKSAENGYTKAQEFLAAAYQEGWFGLPRDSLKAEYWNLRLAEQGL
jgi:TPR repeat protein